jgi:large subunit ribosomal protein L29
MPMKRMREIREISDEERLKRLSELKTELVRMKTMVKAGGAIENPSRIRELRKTIARIKTVMNEKTERGKQE